MDEQFAGAPIEQYGGADRRKAIAGATWAVPVVVVATGAPAIASSSIPPAPPAQAHVEG